MAQLTSCLLFSHQLDSWASSGAAAPPLLLTAWSPFCGLQWFRCCCRGSSAVYAGVRAHMHACDNVNGKPRVKSALPLQSSEVERCFQGRYGHLKKIQQTLLSTSLEVLGLKSLAPYWQIQLFNLPVKLIITLHWQHLSIPDMQPPRRWNTVAISKWHFTLLRNVRHTLMTTDHQIHRFRSCTKDLKIS